jgi:hypothetical protein
MAFKNDEVFTSAAAVTPADGTDLAHVAYGLVATVAGVASVVTEDGQTVVVPLAIGVPLLLSVVRVRATGTTATGIVALW